MHSRFRNAHWARCACCTAAFISGIIFCSAGRVRAQCATVNSAVHRADDGGSKDHLGSSVAVGGGAAFLGSPGNPSFTDTGAAYVLRETTSGWVAAGKLTASDGVPGDRFGSSVATDGTWAIVGADGAGAAYMFHFNGSGWVEKQKIVPPGGATFFGFSAALSGNTVVVGAYGDQTYTGKAFAFTFNGSTWEYASTFSADDGNVYDFFGAAVGVSGDTIAVGAYGVDSGASNLGAVYVYRRTGATWSYLETLRLPNPTQSDSFGRSVGVSGDVLVVGSPKYDVNGTDAGAAHVFRFDGVSWIWESELMGSDTVAGDKFGTSISIDGSTILVGAPKWDDQSGITNRGSAYTFSYDGATWQQSAQLIAVLPYGWYDDAFGYAVAVADRTALVGAWVADGPGLDGGHGYSYTLDCGGVAAECIGNSDCNDGNICTTDTCANGTCLHIDNTASCNDGNACTTVDRCSAGSCSGTPLNCDDGIACTTDSCVSGSCVSDGSACECISNVDCNDGVPCTLDRCVAGACKNDASFCECVVDSDCDDQNDCTADLCSAKGICLSEPLAYCCGNGVCEKGEDSCSCSADCQDQRAAVCGNGVCETADGEDCLSCSLDCLGVQSGSARGMFCCGAGAGTNPVGCGDIRCFSREVTCRSDPVVEPCCGDGVCESYESGCTCSQDCGAPLANEAPGASCQDGIDNDCDGLVDCDDPNCMKESSCWTCDGDGVCEPGEDCKSCPSDCAGLSRGRRVRRFCCGNGLREAAERDPAVCDGNP